MNVNHRSMVWGLYLWSLWGLWSAAAVCAQPIASANAKTAINYALLQDQSTYKLATDAMAHIYAWDFEEAERLVVQVNQRASLHPVSPMLRALLYYWRRAPFPYDNAALVAPLLKDLSLTEAMSDKRLKAKPDDLEGLFFKSLACSMRMRYHVSMGERMRAASLAGDVYALIRKSDKHLKSFSELYFLSGLYQYYRVAFPEQNPMYRPLAAMFPKGDKARGIAELQHAARNAAFTASEARSYLMRIYFTYEKQPQKAVVFAREAVELCPKNKLYWVAYLTLLSRTRQYNMVSEHLAQLQGISDPFYAAAYHGLQAQVFQWKQQPDLAQVHQQKAEKLAEGLGCRRFLMEEILGKED